MISVFAGISVHTIFILRPHWQALSSEHNTVRRIHFPSSRRKILPIFGYWVRITAEQLEIYVAWSRYLCCYVHTESDHNVDYRQTSGNLLTKWSPIFPPALHLLSYTNRGERSSMVNSAVVVVVVIDMVAEVMI